MLGISAVVVVVLTAISTAVQASTYGDLTELSRLDGSEASLDALSGVLASTLTGYLGIVLVSLVAVSVLSGVVTVAVSTAVLGRRTAPGQLWRRVRPRAAALIGLALVMTLLEGLVFTACLAPGGVLLAVGLASSSGGTTAGGAVLLLLGALAGLCATLFLDVRLFLAPPALVLEDQRLGAALKRAWRLSRQGFWRLLGTRVLSLIIVAVAGQVIITAFAIIGGLVDAAVGGGSTLASLVVAGVGQALAYTFLYPLSAAVTALQYIDQRMRREGLDVELARAAADPA